MKIFNAFATMGLLVFTVTGCGERIAGYAEETIEEHPETWRNEDPGKYRIKRPVRTATEVLDRAQSIAEIVLQDEELPRYSTWVDSSLISGAESDAKALPHVMGSLKIDHDPFAVTASYIPATDTLRIFAIDQSEPFIPEDVVPSINGEIDEGMGRNAARRVALGCLRALETKGVILPAKFDRTPHEEGRQREGGDVHFIRSYDFSFGPKLDGLRLRDSEVRIEVDARTGRCSDIAVSDVIVIERIKTARLRITEADAPARFEEKVLEELATETSTASVAMQDSYVGYVIPAGQIGKVVAKPSFVGSFSMYVNHPDWPTPSHSQGMMRVMSMTRPGRALTTPWAGEELPPLP